MLTVATHFVRKTDCTLIHTVKVGLLDIMEGRETKKPQNAQNTLRYRLSIR